MEIRPRRAGPRRENWLPKKKAAGRTHPISVSLAVRVEKSAYNAGRTPDGLEDRYWPCLTPPQRSKGMWSHPRLSPTTDCLSKYSRSVWCRYSSFTTIEVEPPRFSNLKSQMRESRPASLSCYMLPISTVTNMAQRLRSQIFTHLLLLLLCFIGAKQKPTQSADDVDSLHILHIPLSTEVNDASACKISYPWNKQQLCGR